MFHADVVAARVEALLADPDLGPLLPDGLDPLPHSHCLAMRRHLDLAWDPDAKAPTRPLTRDEQVFVAHEQLRSKVDYEYCATRYHFISAEGRGVKPLFPLWESQRVMLDQIARVEKQRIDASWGGLFFNILKARQLGASTLTQSIIGHAVTTQGHLRAMVSSDVEDNSVHMFGMFETILEHLPWWLTPTVVTREAGRRRNFKTGSRYWAAWGKSGRGQLQDQGGRKGHLGRVKTVSKFHLTELSSWENPEQINDSFLPGVPTRPSSFGICESTAKGRGNWWHKWWELAGKGRTLPAFVNIFIPWYAEPSKWSAPAPADWTPAGETLAHARRCEASSFLYLGRTARLTRDQLFWWEMKRAEFDERGMLYQFLEEYPADPAEAFQFSSRSCFPVAVIERLRNLAKPPIVVCELQPETAAAHLLQEEREKLSAAEQGREYVRPAQIGPAQPLLGAGPTRVPVLLPDGYGFRALGRQELKERPSLLDVLQVYEAPRRRGPRAYVIVADVSEGVQADRSAVDVIRIPTLLEPAEQVAQFITDTRSPVQLAYVMDALGRWYTDADGREAQAGIEVNIGPGGSTQDTLQLHLGYGHFFVWEYIDARDPSRRQSNRIGWATTSRTRPMLLARFYAAVTTIDPVTKTADLVINSPWTLTDMQNFVSPTGRLEDGEAAPGMFDDCVMSGGIGAIACWRLAGGEHVPIDERRRQRAAEIAARAETSQQQSHDWRESPVPADYSTLYLRPEDDPGDPSCENPVASGAFAEIDTASMFSYPVDRD